jgi:integrase
MWLTAGPRPHEMLGLRPEDLDLAGSVAKVTRQLRRGGQERIGQLRRGGQERVATKTMTSQRDLNLTPIAIDALRAHKERVLAEGLRASPWLFPSLTGTAMTTGT